MSHGSPKALYELFAGVASGENATNLAVTAGTRSLTFEQLHARVERVRRNLSESPAGPDRAAVLSVRDADPSAAVARALAAWSFDMPAFLEPYHETPELGVVGTAPMVTGPAASARAAGEGRSRQLGRQALEQLREQASVAVVLPTSGSTGEPKFVLHSPLSLLRGVIATASLQAMAFGSEPFETNSSLADILAYLADARTRRMPLTFMSVLPFGTIAGLNLFLRAMAFGDHVVFSPTRDLSDLLATVTRQGVTSLALTPLVARRLVSSRMALAGDTIEIGSLMAIGVGGGAAEPGVLSRLERLIPQAAVLSGYGTTEVAGPVCSPLATDPADVRWTTVGKPIPGISVELRPSRDHSYGHVILRSPTMMLGYLGEDHASPRTAFEPGDFGEFDNAKNLVLRGRASLYISRGSRRLDPSPIESCARQLLGVVDAAAVGVDSRVSGNQDIWLVLEVKANGGPTKLQVRDLCRSELPRHYQPRRISMVGALPRTADGGVRYGEVRRLVESLDQDHKP